MAEQGLLGRAWNEIAYWTQYATLSLYGSARQDRRTDPVERLKRRYGKAPSV